jgi:hypothetical protein
MRVCGDRGVVMEGTLVVMEGTLDRGVVMEGTLDRGVVIGGHLSPVQWSSTLFLRMREEGHSLCTPFRRK